jgi:hypothetical protein
MQNTDTYEGRRTDCAGAASRMPSSHRTEIAHVS